jgi:hypothetical protein
MARRTTYTPHVGAEKVIIDKELGEISPEMAAKRKKQARGPA